MKTRNLVQAACALAAIVVWTLPASAQTDPCSCEEAVCDPLGFMIHLEDFSVDQDNGESSWTYQVCVDHAQCNCDAQYQNAGGNCHNLSHIDISLPGLGTCLTTNQSISIAQTGGVTAAALECVPVTEKDPACDIEGTAGSDFVAKCNVADGQSLDDGECVDIKLTIAGEQPSLGRGAASSISKSATDCVTSLICGPACNCYTAPQEEACLTHTAGFWGTHPAITSMFLPITVCGQELSVTTAGSCDSVTEALCVSPGLEANKSLDKNPPYAQLVRQLAAAKLNLAATAANDGGCGDEIAARIAECEAKCGATKGQINASGCVEDLTAFNESVDTFAVTPPPFDAPGRAMPAECQAATGNGIVIGKKCN
jgi:hypothetical protein